MEGISHFQISMKTLISIDKLQIFIYSLLGTIKQTVCIIQYEYADNIFIPILSIICATKMEPIYQ
ncbi:conserved hypothetical protein [Trichinella spiralis]|uniref:hypothetical protein n=1 Tax=Trichinella spiralis TaxID=6334 RepID=UPI0001EFB902|nr:conserved hypothetical protein [Trichinella spiralis]